MKGEKLGGGGGGGGGGECNTTVLAIGSSWPPQIHSSMGWGGETKKLKHKRYDFQRFCTPTAFMHLS